MATPSPVCTLVAALRTISTCVSSVSSSVHVCCLEYLPHDAVGSLTKFLRHIVLLAHDKVLVENLEDLATL